MLATCEFCHGGVHYTVTPRPGGASITRDLARFEIGEADAARIADVMQEADAAWLAETIDDMLIKSGDLVVTVDGLLTPGEAAKADHEAEDWQRHCDGLRASSRYI